MKRKRNEERKAKKDDQLKKRGKQLNLSNYKTIR